MLRTLLYKGNKLPPFYIGYAKLVNIENGYFGSVSSKEYKNIWIDEITHNRHLFKSKIIKIFDNKKDAIAHEVYLQKFFSVHTNPMFINKSILNEKFYNIDNFGHKHTQETKDKLKALTKEQFKNPVKRKKHMDRFLESNGNHKNKIWINKDGVNKRVTLKQFNSKYSDWQRGRIIHSENKFYEHGNRKRCHKTGRFLKKEENSGN